jgi:carbonic anhydrase
MIFMSQTSETFFTSIGCMDGRVQDPILRYGRKKFGVKYADTITEAGIVGLLAKENVDPDLLDSIKKKILISLEKHHSKGIIVHGHEECAGNPVDEDQHKKDVLKTAKTIDVLVQKDIQIIPVYVKRSKKEWIVEGL